MDLNYVPYISNRKRYNLLTTLITKRNYSTSSPSSTNLPLPIKIFSDLHDNDKILSYSKILRNKAGIYSFVNTINDERYLGSAKDLYLRLIEHLSNKKSNSALQNAIVKHGLDKFNFCLYEYFTYHTKVVSHWALTDLETSYIEKYPYNKLYNRMRPATNITGCKHTDEAKLNMLKRYVDKSNLPMYGKKHRDNVLKLISKPGELNPMFGKQHSDITKQKISNKLSKHPNGVGIYDLNDNLISKFKNNVKLAKHLNISKATVGRYLNSGTVYNNIYRFKVNNT